MTRAYESFSPSDSFRHKTSGAGLGLKGSAAAIIAGIFVAWIVVEALLTARFWLQLTAADRASEVHSTILTLTGPLVAPFGDFQSSTVGATNGVFEYGTVIAAEVVLILAIVLVILTVVVSNVLAVASVFAPRTRPELPSSLVPETAGSAPLSNKASRLRNTFFIAMTPSQARLALKDLALDRFSVELVTIPAEGGSVVAVFAPMESENSGVPVLSRLRRMRQEHTVARLLQSIGGTPAMPGTAGTLPSVASSR